MGIVRRDRFPARQSPYPNQISKSNAIARSLSVKKRIASD
jgi:hypothetical protein